MHHARLFTLPMTAFHHAEDEPSFTDVYHLFLYALERADCLAVVHGGKEDETFTEADYLFYIDYYNITKTENSNGHCQNCRFQEWQSCHLRSQCSGDGEKWVLKWVLLLFFRQLRVAHQKSAA